VTIGGIQDPSEIQRTYDDIRNILKNHTFKEYGETHADGTFKKFVIEV
jgi:virulence-associated protein VapD